MSRIIVSYHHRSQGRNSLRAVLASILLTALHLPCSAQVQVRLGFPNPDPGGPNYARVERPFQIHTSQLAAILFYRDPACVPETFNLLDMVDLVGFPGPTARPFGCPATVDGFQLWTTYPIPGPPNQVFTRGTGAVPVWFVTWSELETALRDDKLTIGELRSMPSLQIGHAIRFEETLQLSPRAETLAIRMAASGDLLDGRRFEFQFALSNGRVTDIQIRLENLGGR
jgi:hypothetical protein